MNEQSSVPLRGEGSELSPLGRVRQFLHAYASGDATTFVGPRTGDLVSANKEARALADACLKGPVAEIPSDLTADNARLQAAVKELAEGLGGLLVDMTDFHCKWCNAHARLVNDDGDVTEAFHTAGCPVRPARALIAKHGAS